MSSRKIDDYNIYAVKSHLENENIFVNTCNYVKKLILNIQLECIV